MGGQRDAQVVRLVEHRHRHLHTVESPRDHPPQPPPVDGHERPDSGRRKQRRLVLLRHAPRAADGARCADRPCERRLVRGHPRRLSARGPRARSVRDGSRRPRLQRGEVDPGAHPRTLRALPLRRGRTDQPRRGRVGVRGGDGRGVRNRGPRRADPGRGRVPGLRPAPRRADRPHRVLGRARGWHADGRRRGLACRARAPRVKRSRRDRGGRRLRPERRTRARATPGSRDRPRDALRDPAAAPHHGAPGAPGAPAARHQGDVGVAQRARAEPPRLLRAHGRGRRRMAARGSPAATARRGDRRDVGASRREAPGHRTGGVDHRVCDRRCWPAVRRDDQRQRLHADRRDGHGAGAGLGGIRGRRLRAGGEPPPRALVGQRCDGHLHHHRGERRDPPLGSVDARRRALRADGRAAAAKRYGS